MVSQGIHGHLDLLILTVVEGGAKHGYGIIGDLKDRSGGRFDLPEGTIYPALHRLESRGLLESTWAEGVTRKRRIYRLSPRGTRMLAVEKSKWSELSTGIRSILEWSPCLSTT